MRALSAADSTSWRLLPVLTSRALRSGEVEKIQVAEQDIQRLYEQGGLLYVSKSFGTLYGWRLADLTAAADSDAYWMVDFRLALRGLLARFTPSVVLLMPPNEAALEARIRSADRVDRLQEILRDLRENYGVAALESLDKEGALILTAEDGEGDLIARQVRDYCHALARRRGTRGLA
jgi:guanylate kinase